VTIDLEVAAMRRIALFSGIEPKRLKMLAAVCDRIRFAPGEVVFRQGDDADAAYVVLDGTADIVDESGTSERSIAKVGRHAIIGEIAIICDIARTATVRAETALDTLRIMREHFLLLLREQPEAAIVVMRTIGQRLADRTAEVALLRSKYEA
jgi:CRP-like cAMP-binding protein